MNFVETLPEPQQLHSDVDSADALDATLQNDLVHYDLIQASSADSGQVVDAEPVRTHLRLLMDSGMAIRTIAVLSGVSRTTLSRVLYGRPSHNVPPQANISEENYHRILCVTTGMISDDEKMTGATGSTRRLQALAVLGYSMKNISEESGVSYYVLLEVEKQSRVKATVSVAIQEAYERLRNQSPKMDTPAEKKSVSKIQSKAMESRWLPPRAWDDATIDDPAQEGRLNCECKTVKHKHGTRDAYLTDKCRCTPCKKAYGRIAKVNRILAGRGLNPNQQVDAGPVRKHVAKLLRRGWSVDLIADGSGVGRATVSRLLYGDSAKKKKAVKTVSVKTSNKLLAFTPTERRKRYDGTALESVDATDTKRRVQALVACGYSMAFLANEFGTHRQVVSNILQSERVLRTKAEAFKDIYDKLWNIAPPQETPAEKKAYTTSKKFALQNGWPLPNDLER